MNENIEAFAAVPRKHRGPMDWEMFESAVSRYAFLTSGHGRFIVEYLVALALGLFCTFALTLGAPYFFECGDPFGDSHVYGLEAFSKCDARLPVGESLHTAIPLLLLMGMVLVSPFRRLVLRIQLSEARKFEIGALTFWDSDIRKKEFSSRREGPLLSLRQGALEYVSHHFPSLKLAVLQESIPPSSMREAIGLYKARTEMALRQVSLYLPGAVLALFLGEESWKIAYGDSMFILLSTALLALTFMGLLGAVFELSGIFLTYTSEAYSVQNFVQFLEKDSCWKMEDRFIAEDGSSLLRRRDI